MQRLQQDLNEKIWSVFRSIIQLGMTQTWPGGVGGGVGGSGGREGRYEGRA